MIASRRLTISNANCRSGENGLDPIEKAIRNALAKGDAEDRAFREKVYRSAFAALERATQSQPELTVEVAINRRRNLQAKVTSIESEYLPALPPEPEHMPDDSPEVSLKGVAPDVEYGPDSDAPEVMSDRQEPGRTAPAAPPVQIERSPAAVESPADRREPEVDIGVAPVPRPGAPRKAGPAVADVSPDRDEARARTRRHPFAAMFVAVTLFAAVAMAGWWAFQVGLFKLPSEIDTSVPNPPKVVDGEDFNPEDETPGLSEPGKSDDLRNWITVFSPSDASSVNAPSGATAQVSNDESGNFLRIRSGATGAAVIFDVGQGVLEQLAGGKAVFDIVARSEGGKQTEISISCDFGELGDCGRKRYVVGYERAEYLFDVEFPAGRPGAGGSIAINSDFANGGNAVDIYQIRASVMKP